MYDSNINIFISLIKIFIYFIPLYVNSKLTKKCRSAKFFRPKIPKCEVSIFANFC